HVGGAQGIGVTFLEEAFSASTAPPAHRLHQKAARDVLRALLPEEGTKIRGQMRSHDELLAASGYGSRPRDFEDLMRILDTTLRLVTPTDPEALDQDRETGRQGDKEIGDSGRESAVEAVSLSPCLPVSLSRYYQLTHDYLVPALRQWLTRKQ